MAVCIKENIDAPIARVWNMISDFGGIKRWHPLVERCEITGQGVGAKRAVYFADWSAEEILEALDPVRHHLTYRVTASSRPATVGVCGKLTLTPIGKDQTILEWVASVPSDRPDIAEMDRMLAAVYPARFQHLRQALGVAK